MKGIITSLGMIVFAGAVVAGGTGAFFSDTETSTANVFTAGAIDLKVDSVGHVNGLVCFDKKWTPETIVKWVPEEGENEGFLQLNPLDADVSAAMAAYNTANPANVPKAGDVCGSTWALTDLKNGVHTFFNFTDVKPGDEGENTISLHVDNNDAWMCADVNITKNDDVSSTEPELEAGDVQEDGANNLDGELAKHMNFFAWLDDGDNIWQKEEPKLFSNTSGPASDVLGGKTYALADSTTGNGPIEGATTHYIGLAWCAGTIDASTLGVILCDGSTMGNEAQTDMLEASIAFRVEQARNNEEFRCNPPIVKPKITTLSLEKVIVQDEVGIVDEDLWELTATGLIDTISGIEGSAEVTVAVITPGDYDLTEDVISGFTQTLLECVGSEGQIPVVDGAVTISEGDHVTCTFTNTEEGVAPQFLIRTGV